jgi:putative endonuclease
LELAGFLAHNGGMPQTGVTLGLLESQAATGPSLGERGERMAADHLVRNGYRLIAANYKVPVGRNSKGVQVTGEIDLIGLDADTLCFIEVKTRRSDEFNPVTANVTLRKQRQIIRTARMYRRLLGITNMPVRYDVVAVLLQKHSAPVVELEKGFFSENKFRKRSWESPVWR